MIRKYYKVSKYFDCNVDINGGRTEWYFENREDAVDLVKKDKARNLFEFSDNDDEIELYVSDNETIIECQDYDGQVSWKIEEIEADYDYKNLFGEELNVFDDDVDSLYFWNEYIISRDVRRGLDAGDERYVNLYEKMDEDFMNQCWKKYVCNKDIEWLYELKPISMDVDRLRKKIDSVVEC